MGKVTDKRQVAMMDNGPSDEFDSAEHPVPATDTKRAMPVVEVTEEVDPVRALVERTFTFIIHQPEWQYVLQLPKPVRKKIGQDFGKLLSRFPHFKKVVDAQRN